MGGLATRVPEGRRGVGRRLWGLLSRALGQVLIVLVWILVLVNRRTESPLRHRLELADQDMRPSHRSRWRSCYYEAASKLPVSVFACFFGALELPLSHLDVNPRG